MHVRNTLSRILMLATALALPAVGTAVGAEPARILADGQLEMAGRKMSCGEVELRLDRRLPNLGAASPHEQMLWINPRLLASESPTVQLFVFHHECGHHHVGASELGSDCWAVEKGVEAGWLSDKGLSEVCDSFGGAPESSTHPSARRRCANLDRCYAAAQRNRRPVTPVQAAVKPSDAPAQARGDDPVEPRREGGALSSTVAMGPQLVGAPRLLWTGEGR